MKETDSIIKGDGYEVVCVGVSKLCCIDEFEIFFFFFLIYQFRHYNSSSIGVRIK